jgi:glucose/arabinose dehydrogenase
MSRAVSRIARPWHSLVTVGALVLGIVACGDDDEPEEAPPVDDTVDEDTVPPEEPDEPDEPPVPPLDDITLNSTEIGQFASPISIVSRPDDPTALFVAERQGRVIRLDIAGEGLERSYTPDGDPVVDISDEVVTGRERGLLDIEFSPDGERLYLSYSIAPDGDSRITSYEFDGQAVDEGSRREVLGLEQPFGNHNGGAIAFGPDGYLYFGLGDGGRAGDPLDAGQDTSTWLGAMLRIDPEATLGTDDPYAVPDDNPFVDEAGAEPEIWLYGLRNPWRFSFDTETGDLWIADVGQDAWEEINWLPADDEGGRGANLGWSEMEGTHPFAGGSNPPDGVLPVFDYPIPEEGCAVVGGMVYRGDAIAGLEGNYLFGDYCNPTLRALEISDGEVERDVWFDDIAVQDLVSFGEDDDGEVYLVSLNGPIYRLDP